MQFSPFVGRINAYYDSVESRALVNDLASHVNQGRRWILAYRAYWISFWSLLLFALINLTLGLALIATIKRDFGRELSDAAVVGYWSAAVTTGLIVAAAVMYPLWRVRTRGSVRVINRWRKDAHGISSETRRLIAVGLIASAIGAVISGVFGFWQGLFLK
jgi:hypothetical protein